MLPPKYKVIRGFMFAVPPPAVVDTSRSPHASYQRWMWLMTNDHHDRVLVVWEMLAYLARYGGQAVDAASRWPISQVRRVAHMVAKIVKAENTPRDA